MSWAAVIVGGATLVGGAVASRGAKDAANAQGRAGDAAVAEQQRQFDTMLNLTANQRAIGNQALNALGGIYGYAPATGWEGAGPSSFGGSGELILSQGGVPAINPERYANDPAYRYAWDKTLEWEKANRPGWNGQETYWAKATNEDWTRLSELMSRNLAEYNAQNPQAGQGGSAGNRTTYQVMPDGSVRQILSTGPESSGGNQLAGPDYSAFYQSPDYQFRLSQGLNAVQGSAAAQGGLYSGNALRAINDYGSGTAANEFGNYVNRQLALAGMGQTATTQAGNAAMQTGANIGNLLVGQGNARASGIIGQTNAVTGGINDLASLYGMWRGGYFDRPAAGGS